VTYPSFDLAPGPWTRPPEPDILKIRVVDERHPPATQMPAMQALVADTLAFVAAFRLHHTAFPFIRGLTLVLHDDMFQFLVNTKVPDRRRHLDPHGDDNIVVTFNRTDSYVDGQRFMHIVHTVIQQMVVHELDECFYVGGSRPFDPHKNDPTPVIFTTVL
jgi:hypothetical protein